MKDIPGFYPGIYLFSIFPCVLNPGQLCTGSTKAWIGGYGEITKGSAYTHPSTKQCNYSIDTSGFATASHSHSANDITSGVLPVDRGGTGCGSLDELKNLIQTWAPKTYNGITYTQRVQINKSYRRQADNNNWRQISWLDLRGTIFNGSNIVGTTTIDGSNYNLSNLQPVYYMPNYNAYAPNTSYESGATLVGYGLDGDNHSSVPNSLIFYLL